MRFIDCLPPSWYHPQEHGHPDLVALGLRTEAEVWGFAGPIPSVERLVHVLATIAWLASGHHAAVNFGQYDFSSLILNASSLVRKPMPAPSSDAYKVGWLLAVAANGQGVHLQLSLKMGACLCRVRPAARRTWWVSCVTTGAGRRGAAG